MPDYDALVAARFAGDHAHLGADNAENTAKKPPKVLIRFAGDRWGCDPQPQPPIRLDLELVSRGPGLYSYRQD